METSNEKSTATLIHLTMLSQYIIPLCGFILPLLIWSNQKEKSQYINHHGKQALNFQLSMFLYTIVFLIISIPTFIIWLFNAIEFSKINEYEFHINEVINSQNISGYVILGFAALLLFILVKLAEFFLIIYASAKTSNGEYYKYPLTIPFLK